MTIVTDCIIIYYVHKSNCIVLVRSSNNVTKVLLENGWNSKQMITEGDTAILLETTRCAFGNQEKSKLRSTIAVHNQCSKIGL